MESFSDQKILTDLSDWLQSSEGSQLTEETIVIVDQVKGLEAILEIEENRLKLCFSKDDGTEECNLKLAMGELRKIGQVMKFIMQAYNKFFKSKNGFGEIHGDMDVDCYDGQEDQEMSNAWEELDQPDEDINSAYINEIHAQVAQDKIEQAKVIGVTDDTLVSTIINTKSIRLFEKTKFYKEILDAKDYLIREEKQIKGWLNLVVLKEFLSIRAEIDLNYIDLHPSNIFLLGWKIEEPVIIVLEVSEVKILNTQEDEYDSLNFQNMWNQGMLNFNVSGLTHLSLQCINASSQESFGCKDYMRRAFVNFIKDVLNVDGDSDEEEKDFQSLSKKKQKAKSKGSQGSGFGFISRFFSTTQVDDELLAQLVEMGYETKVASKNLKKANNDLDKALDLIREEELNALSSVSDKELQTQLSSKSVPFTKNKVVKMMLYLSDYLEQATRNCFLCGEQLEAESIKLLTCKREHCEFTFEEMFKGTLYSEFQFGPHIAAFDLALAAKALFSGRADQVFEPFPSFFLQKFENRKPTGDLFEIQQAKKEGRDVSTAKKTDKKNKMIKEMIEIFSKLPNPVNLMHNVSSEDELREKIYSTQKTEKEGLLAYKLLSYVFATNRSSIIQLQPEDFVVSSEIFDKQYILISQDHTKERKFLNSKKQQKSIFCWHGSSVENWYSILRNGLRNLSNSTMMTAGAAYGPGIYASSQFQTSWGYSARYTMGQRTWANMPAFLQNQFVIAIVEIINRSGYSKDPNSNIVVVPEEDDIQIRYLFVLKQGGYPTGNELVSTKIEFDTHYQKMLKGINHQRALERAKRIQEAYQKYRERKQKQEADMKRIQEQTREKIEKADEEELEKQFLEMTKRLTGKGSAGSTQRISKDYAGLLKSSEFKSKLEVEFLGNNMYVWRVYFDLLNYEVSKDLKKDFQDLEKKMGNKKKSMLQYEVIFPDSYPMDPPFIRVVFPRFAFHTGHVTVGGSICIQSLTPSGWSSARSIESYFVEVISLINAGNARLDLNNLMPYSLQEAKEAFNRVARDHGWLK